MYLRYCQNDWKVIFSPRVRTSRRHHRNRNEAAGIYPLFPRLRLILFVLFCLRLIPPSLVLSFNREGRTRHRKASSSSEGKETCFVRARHVTPSSAPSPTTSPNILPDSARGIEAPDRQGGNDRARAWEKRPPKILGPVRSSVRESDVNGAIGGRDHEFRFVFSVVEKAHLRTRRARYSALQRQYFYITCDTTHTNHRATIYNRIY